MPNEESEHHHHHHRHHKEHWVRRAKQIHGGGGRPHEVGEGLQLPQRRFGPWFGPYASFPFVTYPKGWKFNWLTPGRAALLVTGGSFLIMVLCIALAKLLAS